MNCEKYDGWYPDYRSIVVVKPIKGVDYWTDEDKKEIVGETADQLKKSIPEIDGTLKIKGAAADAAVVGEKFTEVSRKKVDKPTNGNGTPGQALFTNGDGTTYWGTVSNGDGLSVTDDGNGNVTIVSTGGASITDDGNGNVVIA